LKRGNANTPRRFDTCGPAIEAFPAFIAETNYQDITSNTKTPFQKGHNTDLTCFQWLAQRPKLFNALQQVMTAIQSSDWLVGLDVLKEAANVIPGGTRGPSGGPFLVDFGGGRGRRCIQLLEKYPNLCSLLVLQDLPQAVDKLPPIEDVKVMAQDFFKNQTIEGISSRLSLKIHNSDETQVLSSITSVGSCTTGPMTHASRS